MSESLATCCANCIEPFPTLPYKPASKFIVSITRSLPDDVGEAVDFKPVTILDALKTIFGFTFLASGEAEDDEDGTVENYLVLCSKCTEHLAKLYELYCGFKRICHIDSYISTHKIEGDFKICERDNLIPLKTRRDIPNGHLQRLQKRITKEPEVTAEASLPALNLSSVRTRKIAQPVGHYNMDSESEDDDTFDDPRDVLDLKYDEDWEPDSAHPFNSNEQIPKSIEETEEPEEPDEPDEPGIVPKRKRGRPRTNTSRRALKEITPKRKRGRPRKNASPDQDTPKRKRGRPRKLDADSATESTTPDGETTSPTSVRKFKRGRPRKGEIRPTKTKSDGTKRKKRGRPSMSLSGKAADPENPRVFKCELCGKEARNNWNLKLHIRGVHEGYRQHQCLLCKRYYTNKNYLINHLKSVHNREPNQYICQEPGCGKAFAYPAGLRVHSFTHTGQTLFSCEICGKGFRRGCDLQSHMTRHTNARPFICEHCGCSFKSKSNLRKHCVTHDVEWKLQGKPQPTCEICKRTFLMASNLRIHVRTVHEGLKPFKCQICGKAFSSTSNLKVHLSGYHKCPKDANNDIILPPVLPDPKQAREGSLAGSEPEVPAPPTPPHSAHTQIQPTLTPVEPSPGHGHAHQTQHAHHHLNFFQLPIPTQSAVENHHHLHHPSREDPSPVAPFPYSLNPYFNYNLHRGN